MARQQQNLQRPRWPIIALPLGFLLAALALRAWLGGFEQVRSSSGAWTLLHVDRVLLAGGDYGAACCVGMNPSSFSSPLYPWLVARVSLLSGAAPAATAHWISGGAVGLIAAALYGLWRPISGPIPAAAAAAVALFPPLLALGSLARYDTTAAALVLLCAWSALGASDSRRAAAWVLPGILAGLAYSAREFMAGPAVGALGMAWLLDALAAGRHYRSRRARWLRRGGSLGWLALGAAGVAAGFPAALGLSPLGGLDAILEYSVPTGGASLLRKSLTDVLYLDVMWGPLLFGAAGLVVTTAGGWRRGDHRSAVLWGMLLPFVAFFSSARQSAVYYLLLHVLLLSGAAGLIALLPHRALRAAAGLIGAGWLGWLAHGTVPRLLGGPADLAFESEAWPVPPQEAMAAMAWANQQLGEGAALVVATDFLENFDALSELYHGRPAASLFSPSDPGLGQLVSLYRGREIDLLTVEHVVSGLRAIQPEARAPLVGATLLDQQLDGSLRALLYRVDPSAFAPVAASCQGSGRVSARGACLQAAWLEGGRAGLADWITAHSPSAGSLLRIKQPCR